MAQALKSLVKDTAIYGISSMLGKFLNWCLVPLYTYILTSSAEYGIVTNLYAWTALLLVILTYGMETGFFRFVNKKENNPTTVYSSVLLCVGATSLLFAVVVNVLAGGISEVLGYGTHPEFIGMMGAIVAMDAFGSIPFAYLRYQNKSVRFALLKLAMILMNIGMNIFFLVICPKLQAAGVPIGWFFNPEYGVGYVFVANLISTIFVTLLLLPQMLEAKFQLDKDLLKNILQYSLPLLVLGVAGIMNQTLDKIIYPYLLNNMELAQTQLGVYGACFKVAMVMMVFTQAFRYAYEPFVFAQNKSGDEKTQYALAMKYFFIFSLLIFLGMTLFVDVFKLLIRHDYWEGLNIIPMVLLAYIFQGVYFNLSIWYKLIDKTIYGAIFSFIGLIITLVCNVVFVPLCNEWFGAGYYASAGSSVVCFFIIMVLSYVIGQKYFPIDYDLKKMGLYSLVTTGIYVLGTYIQLPNIWLNYAFRIMLFCAFCALILCVDMKGFVPSLLKKIHK